MSILSSSFRCLRFSWEHFVLWIWALCTALGIVLTSRCAITWRGILGHKAHGLFQSPRAAHPICLPWSTLSLTSASFLKLQMWSLTNCWTLHSVDWQFKSPSPYLCCKDSYFCRIFPLSHTGFFLSIYFCLKPYSFFWTGLWAHPISGIWLCAVSFCVHSTCQSL